MKEKNKYIVDDDGLTVYRLGKEDKCLTCGHIEEYTAHAIQLPELEEMHGYQHKMFRYMAENHAKVDAQRKEAIRNREEIHHYMMSYDYPVI